MPVENVACQDNPGGRQPDQTRAWSPLDMSGRFICCHGKRYTARVFFLSIYLMLANRLVFRRMFSWVTETGTRKPCIKPLVLSATLMLPAAILVAPRLGEASYILLAVVGVYYFLQNYLHSTEYKNILLLSLLTLGFYLVALASVLISDNYSASLEKLGNLREFLAAPFIGLLLLDTRVSTRFIMLTVKISALLVFMVVFYQLLTGTGRPGGAVNPLVFAVLSLLLGFFSIIRFPLESALEKL
jgi:hypothetical protein